LAWGRECVDEHNLIHTTQQCREVLELAMHSAEYTDAHKWVFTPTSFRFAIAELRAVGFTAFGVESLDPTHGYEFMAILSRSAPREALSRRDLLGQIDEELRLERPLS
jgi:hypothetical protein